jgi:hypothetical protein
MTATVSAVFVVLGFLGALAALGIYGLTQPWWRNRIGRFFITQAGIIALVYLESNVRLFWHIKLPVWTSVTTNALVAALMIYHAWVFGVIVWQDRRRRRHSDVGATSSGSPVD